MTAKAQDRVVGVASTLWQMLAVTNATIALDGFRSLIYLTKSWGQSGTCYCSGGPFLGVIGGHFADIFCKLWSLFLTHVNFEKEITLSLQVLSDLFKVQKWLKLKGQLKRRDCPYI